MNEPNIDQLVETTLSRLWFFHRDASLSEVHLSKYRAGQILLEHGFTDMSAKRGGLTANMRYLVASALAVDLAPFGPDSAAWEHVLLKAGSYFKVIDVYRIGEKTQITLLNIPEELVPVAKAVDPDADQGLVKQARQQFEEDLESPPAAALQTNEWKKRTAAPLGMSDSGELFFNDGAAPPAPGARRKAWWKLW